MLIIDNFRVGQSTPGRPSYGIQQFRNETIFGGNHLERQDLTRPTLNCNWDDRVLLLTLTVVSWYFRPDSRKIIPVDQQITRNEMVRLMRVDVIECGHCGEMNSPARCAQCDRGFVVTSCHVERHLRDTTAKAVADPNTEAPELCDFCSFKAAGKGGIETVPAGLRQRTCPTCRTEFLTAHGFPLGNRRKE